MLFQIAIGTVALMGLSVAGAFLLPHLGIFIGKRLGEMARPPLEVGPHKNQKFRPKHNPKLNYPKFGGSGSSVPSIFVRVFTFLKGSFNYLVALFSFLTSVGITLLGIVTQYVPAMIGAIMSVVSLLVYVVILPLIRSKKKRRLLVPIAFLMLIIGVGIVLYYYYTCAPDMVQAAESKTGVLAAMKRWIPFSF